MGGPMAGHVAKAGFDLTVWNRSPEKSKPFAELGVPVAESLEELGATCSQVFLCVRGSDDVSECCAELADGFIASTEHESLIIVDHSTISPSVAAQLHQDLAAKEDIWFVDAPITGGSMGAQKGQLTVFCGGRESDIEAARPVMNSYGKRVERVGGPGAGQMTKAANQIAVAGALMGLCEALAFAEKAGLDLTLTRELLSGGAAGSWAFENYGPKILARDWSPGFTVDNQVKDLAYCEEAGEAIGMDLPATHLAHELLRAMQRHGRGNWTTAALFQELLDGGGDA